MTKLEKILSEEFESLKVDLISEYDSKGMRASGQWAESLEIIISGLSAKLIGLPYSQQLESGRSPGKMSNIQALMKWVVVKGIAAVTQKISEIKSLAFAIAIKHMRSGWKREGYGGVELISSVVTKDRIDTIIDKVMDYYIFELQSDIVGFLRHELEAA